MRVLMSACDKKSRFLYVILELRYERNASFFYKTKVLTKIFYFKSGDDENVSQTPREYN